MSGSRSKTAAVNVARTVRYRGEGSPEAVDARRELAGVKIEDYVRQVVDQSPPLTREQRDKIALALKGAPGGGDAR